MHAQRKETQERMGPTPLLPTPAKDIVPEGAPISNNDSVVSSVYSQHSSLLACFILHINSILSMMGTFMVSSMIAMSCNACS